MNPFRLMIAIKFILILTVIFIGSDPCQASDKTTPGVSLPANPSAHDYAKALGDTFADITQKVSPAVVVINIWYPNEPRDETSPEGEEGPPTEFNFPQPKRGGGRVFDSMRPDSQGSGIIVNSDGTIYTNNHVIDKAAKIEVKLKDGEKAPAHVVGVDPNSDVAVIKIDPKSIKAKLAVAELGDSENVRVGEWAIAIGAPFGLEYSVTVGVISAKGRTGLAADPSKPVYEDYLQTDATINPGNSGGPLVDIEGRVIGINTLIRTSAGASGFFNTNTGFAIPINMAHKNAQQIIAQGRVIRPWLGIKIQSIDQLSQEVKTRLAGIKKGVMIQGIDPETPASRSDLKPFDVITQIDGNNVETSKELQQEVLKKKVGQIVKLSVVRNSANMTIELKTGELPAQLVSIPHPLVSEAGQSNTSFGLTVQPLTEPLARRFNIAPNNGLLVSNVDPGSPADGAGLLPGDIIVEADYMEIRTVTDLKKALAQGDPQKGVLLLLVREGSKIFAVMTKNTEQPINK